MSEKLEAIQRLRTAILDKIQELELDLAFQRKLLEDYNNDFLQELQLGEEIVLKQGDLVCLTSDTIPFMWQDNRHLDDLMDDEFEIRIFFDDDDVRYGFPTSFMWGNIGYSMIPREDMVKMRKAYLARQEK